MHKPNIILITWHDAGRWFGCYGQPHVHTPNVDRLAAEGCRFANTVSACAICSPSRAAIVTGRHCQDNGVMYLTNNPQCNRLHPTETHLCNRLHSEHGYWTALFGVQHECAHEHVSQVLAPDERFDNDPWPHARKTAANFEQWLASQANGNQPFYAQIGFFEAHLNAYYSGSPPKHYPQETDTEHGLGIPPYLRDSDRARDTVAHLQGLLRRGDEAIGRVLDALDTNGLADNTMVVMCVDHGVGLPRAKTTCYDSGTGVAWLVRYPKVVPAGTVVEALTAHVDVLPTMFDLLGLPIPDNVQGISFAGHARGVRSDELRHVAYSFMVENTRSIRTQRHKLIRNFRPPAAGGGHGKPGIDVAAACTIYRERPHLELYDLASDPNELVNLVDRPACAETLAALDAELWEFLLDHDDFIVNEPVGNDWQATTRQELVEHCRRTGRTAPTIDGSVS